MCQVRTTVFPSHYVVSDYEIGAIIPILLMRKLRFRDEVIKLPGSPNQ